MITVVLGAPGSGKTSVTGRLASLLAGHVVLDWDAFMGPASALAGRDIPLHPETWPAYRELMRTIMASLGRDIPVVLLGVATPDELEDLPIGAWIVLDCGDQERRRRLHADGRDRDIDPALRDAQRYRSLGLPVMDTTARTPEHIATDLAKFVLRAQQ